MNDDLEKHLSLGWQNVIQRVQPVEPILDKRSANPFHRCGYCNEPLENFDKYCWNCGKAVKWND